MSSPPSTGDTLHTTSVSASFRLSPSVVAPFPEHVERRTSPCVPFVLRCEHVPRGSFSGSHRPTPANTHPALAAIPVSWPAPGSSELPLEPRQTDLCR